MVDYMLEKMSYLMENLNVYPDNMMKNINLTNGLIYSQEVLLALIKKGLNREDAYKIVQENAMKVWKEKCDFKDQLFNNKIVSKYLSEKEIDELFNLDKILVNINKIYDRINL
jgi:adenylosuccinate lyase